MGEVVEEGGVVGEMQTGSNYETSYVQEAVEW